MKILLLGHKGYLGSFLYKNIKNLYTTEDEGFFDNFSGYDVVINCIGYTDIYGCERDKNKCTFFNYTAAKQLIDLYADKAKIINFSSYYVYNYQPICLETSNTNNNLCYSCCKQMMEHYVLKKQGINFRLGKLFGNSIKKQHKLTEEILQTVKNPEFFSISLDHVLFNPTSLELINYILQRLIERKFSFLPSDTYNLANEGITSHYNYGKFIGQYFGEPGRIFSDHHFAHNFIGYGSFLMSLDKIKKYVKLNHWTTDMKEYLKNV